jgi:hypothetical protein
LPRFELMTAVYFENFSLMDTAFAFAGARMKDVTLESVLYGLGVSSMYFLVASSEASTISC